MTIVHVIARKLVVPDVWPAVRRLRLVRSLAESVASGTSTLVAGRRGTGKTTLVADYCRHTERDVAWLDMDAADADPSVFFGYLLAAIRRSRPFFGGRLTALEHVADGDDMRAVANCFLYELLERPGTPLVVVLDNLHRVYDAPWSTPFFVRLLPLLPHDIHVVMIGRGLPPAPLWRLRSKQALHVMDESALAFTEDELTALYAAHGRSISDAAGVIRNTHGRASIVDQLARVGRVGSPFGEPAPRLQHSG